MLDYVPLLLLAVIAIAVGAGQIALSAVLGPKKPSVAKNTPYECGIVPGEDARKSVWVRFYMIAIIFIVFDIEAVFLYPWAVIFRELGLIGLVEMTIFIFILLFGFAYAWKKGALKWQ